MCGSSCSTLRINLYTSQNGSHTLIIKKKRKNFKGTLKGKNAGERLKCGLKRCHGWTGVCGNYLMSLAKAMAETGRGRNSTGTG